MRKDNLLRGAIFTPPMLAWAGFILIAVFSFSSAQAEEKFSGEITSGNINLRSDATVSSEIVCNLNRGEAVEIVKELYDWYKIRLPASAPAFIKKNLVLSINEKTAKVLRDSVNIRLGASESSPIIGKANKDEIVYILADGEDWYKIRPVNNSFGWVHKKFVNKVSAAAKKENIKIEPLTVKIIEEKKTAVIEKKANNEVVVEGLVEPYGKILKRKGTHKLIVSNSETFLLKGNITILNSATYRKVKVTGSLTANEGEKLPVLEVLKVEILN